MSEEELQQIASQLRRPEGEYGKNLGFLMNQGNAFINQYTVEALQVSPGDCILEIGMGNGILVKDIIPVDPSVKYTGCDYSETMVDEASEINKEYTGNGQATFAVAPAHHMPFADASFNKIFSVNTLYFWEDPEATLAEIRRVLKPGGSLFIAIRPKSLMQYYPFVKYGFTLYDEPALSGILRSGNFIVQSISEKQEPAQQLGEKVIYTGTLIAHAIR